MVSARKMLEIAVVNRIRTRSRVILPRFKNFLTAEGVTGEKSKGEETEETGGAGKTSFARPENAFRVVKTTSAFTLGNPRPIISKISARNFSPFGHIRAN